MLRPSLVRAAALALLLASAVPTLALAAESRSPRSSVSQSIFGEMWSGLRGLFTSLSSHIAPDGLLNPDLGQGMDPNG